MKTWGGTVDPGIRTAERRPGEPAEGSRSQQIVVLCWTRHQVFFVTHLFDLAHGFYPEERETALFLRPERRENGERTFRLLPGEPLPTSYGRISTGRFSARLRAADHLRDNERLAMRLAITARQLPL